MKFKFKYTQENGNVLAIAPLRGNCMITIGEDGRYNSVIISKRTLDEVLTTMAQELKNEDSKTSQVS